MWHARVVSHNAKLLVKSALSKVRRFSMGENMGSQFFRFTVSLTPDTLVSQRLNFRCVVSIGWFGGKLSINKSLYFVELRLRRHIIRLSSIAGQRPLWVS